MVTSTVLTRQGVHLFHTDGAESERAPLPLDLLLRWPWLLRARHREPPGQARCHRVSREGLRCRCRLGRRLGQHRYRSGRRGFRGRRRLRRVLWGHPRPVFPEKDESQDLKCGQGVDPWVGYGRICVKEDTVRVGRCMGHRIDLGARTEIGELRYWQASGYRKLFPRSLDPDAYPDPDLDLKSCAHRKLHLPVVVVVPHPDCCLDPHAAEDRESVCGGGGSVSGKRNQTYGSIYRSRSYRSWI